MQSDAILLEDGPLLAVNKPAGLLTLGAIPGVPTLERLVKAWLKERYRKPGNVYLGIPHRLDRPVSGVVVFARNSKAAARLAEQFRERQVRKVYSALVERPPDPPEGELIDWLLKSPDEARVGVVAAGTPGAREARLKYRAISSVEFEENAERPTPNVERRSEARHVLNPQSAIRNPQSLPPTHCQGGKPSLLEIELLTGRMHQIRVQLASRGWPVIGDAQYGSQTPWSNPPPSDPRDAPIALHARSLTIQHPIRYEPLTITAPLPDTWGPVEGVPE